VINLTGEYDLAVEVSLAAINRVLAVLHENQDRRYPVLPHSTKILVDDTPRGAGDPVSEAERTGFQAEVEIQVSTPTLSLPQGDLVADGVAWATRVLGPWTLPQPSDVSVRTGVRAWVKGSPQPPVPEFLHGDLIINANLVRTSSGFPGDRLPGRAAVRGRGGIGPIFGETSAETFIGLDRTSLGAVFQPAPGTTVSSEERQRIEQIIRNLLRSDAGPVTFRVSVPEDVTHWDYKLEPGHASAIATFMLTDRTPAAGAIEPISGGWIPAGAAFAIAVGRDYILPMLKSRVLRDLPDKYTFSAAWGAVSGEVRPDWEAAGFGLEPGRIVLSISGDGDISWFGADDSFSFRIRVGFTLAAVGGGLELRAAGDPEVDLSDLAVPGADDYLEDEVRDRIRDERDRAFEAAREQIRELLQVQRQLDEVLAAIQPAPAGVTLTGVEIRPEGLTVAGTISLAPSTPVVVRQVKRGSMIDALESWIPGGTIDRFRWYRTPPVLTALMLGGTGVAQSRERVEEHRFVTEEDSLGLADVIAPVMCLEVQGTRVTPGGVMAPISAHTCGFYHPLPPWSVTGFPQRAARAWPVLPIRGLRPDGRVGTVGHYSPWASGRAPREGPTTLVVHFAEGDWEQTAAALQEALGTHPPEAALVVAILFPERVLSEVEQASIEAEAAFLVGEDVDGHWAEAFGVSDRPATVLVDPRGRVAWKEEGPLTPANLAEALQEHAERGGRVSWQPVRLGVVVGDLPPEFPFRIGRGAELSLRRLRGRRVALSFWTSWCEPSIEQLREFSRAYESSGGAGPLVLAVGDGESADRAAELAHVEDLPFPLLPDPEREISRRFGVGCWPSTVWIGTTMRIDAVNFGLTALAEPAGALSTRPVDGGLVEFDQPA
jgi:peroxiredoxin